MTGTLRTTPSTFGDVTGEYLALRRGAGMVTGWHDLVWVRGPDAVKFLDGLLSQSIAPRAAGEVVASLLLAPQGKLRVPHRLLVGDGEVGLLTDAGVGATAIEDLSRFKIRIDAVIEAETRDVVSLWGPGAGDVVSAITGEAPPDGWRRHGELVVARAPLADGLLDRYVVVGADPDALVAAGAVPAGRLAVDAVRIEAGEPVMGVDIDEKTIPQEAALVDAAVDFTKGCYMGQELVARIDSRGHVNRHLRGVVVAEAVLPPVGAEIVAGDRVVGAVTSVAESLERRAPVCMALVRREVDPGTVVDLRWDGGSVTATVEQLPLDVWA